MVREIPLFDDQEFEQGQDFNLSLFDGVEQVDVQGVSKGKGFAGTVKRWNHHIGPQGHGSKSKRTIGSTGQSQDPGRVIKGKKMAGQMGNQKKTTQSLEVVRIDLENNLILIKGAVPGATGSKVVVRPAVKAKG